MAALPVRRFDDGTLIKPWSYVKGQEACEGLPVILSSSRAPAVGTRRGYASSAG
jgi:hypothetical protein